MVSQYMKLTLKTRVPDRLVTWYARSSFSTIFVTALSGTYSAQFYSIVLAHAFGNTFKDIHIWDHINISYNDWNVMTCRQLDFFIVLLYQTIQIDRHLFFWQLFVFCDSQLCSKVFIWTLTSLSNGNRRNNSSGFDTLHILSSKFYGNANKQKKVLSGNETKHLSYTWIKIKCFLYHLLIFLGMFENCMY